MANKRQQKKNATKPVKPKVDRPIRITKPDKLEYARLRKNSLSKIKRVKDKYDVDLTEAVYIPPIEEFSTRENFNKWKQQMKSFTNVSNPHYQFKKNSHDVVASKANLIEVKKNTEQAQKITDEMINRVESLPFFSGGVQTGETVADRQAMKRRPTTAGIIRPLDFDFEAMESQLQFDKKLENMRKKSDQQYFDGRFDQLKSNFMDMLEKAFNSDADELVTMVNNLPSEDFYEMFMMFDEFQFEVYYVNPNMSEDAKEDAIGQMMAYIEGYYSDDLDMDMKYVGKPKS